MGHLPTGELSNLWNTYFANTMPRWVTRYFFRNCQDADIQDMLKNAEQFSIQEVEKSKQLLNDAGYPHPDPFDQSDVDVDATPISTDHFILITKQMLAQEGCFLYSMALAASTSPAVREFYEFCWTNAKNLFNQCTTIMVKKGLHHPQLFIPKPDGVHKINKQRYLTGWFAERRPMNAQELSQIEGCFKACAHLKAFLKSFTQLTSSQQFKNHFQRGGDLLHKHLHIFQSIFTDNELPYLPTWESEILETTHSPFSNRLMLFKVTLLTGMMSTRYGTALTNMMRRDLALHFVRLRAELMKYAEDCFNMMIEHEHLDEIPMVQRPT